MKWISAYEYTEYMGLGHDQLYNIKIFLNDRFDFPTLSFWIQKI